MNGKPGGKLFSNVFCKFWLKFDVHCSQYFSWSLTIDSSFCLSSSLKVPTLTLLLPPNDETVSIDVSGSGFGKSSSTTFLVVIPGKFLILVNARLW